MERELLEKNYPDFHMSHSPATCCRRVRKSVLVVCCSAPIFDRRWALTSLEVEIYLLTRSVLFAGLTIKT